MTSWQMLIQPAVTLFSVWVGYILKVAADRKTSLQNHISDIKEEIEKLSSVSLEYWSRNVLEVDRGGIDIQQECKIKSYNHNINKIITN
ncbi:hypothetical protein, partial [Acetobacter cibinongensis]